MSMPMTAIPELRCDMACSLSSVPQASFLRWRGWNTAGPSHYRSSKERHPRQAVSPEGSCSVRRTGAAAMDVGGWLRRLGLEQYDAVFRDNEIDDTVLPKLTAEDLKELGVGLVGHRR